MTHEIIEHLLTEQRNPNSNAIDELSTVDIVKLMNNEDQQVINAIQRVVGNIASAVDLIVAKLSKGGRLVYIGAGTSGRLGVLDASECLPTFGVGEEMVIGIIAGGDTALRHPVENAEDNRQAVIEDLIKINFNESDVLCAIAASGRTPYCISGLYHAKTIGASSIAVTCTDDNPMFALSNIQISLLVGAEIITGSTRLKAGSAQKMVLNMLTTCSMIKLGKTYGNLMVDVKPTNDKLKQRALNMLTSVLEIQEDAAQRLLEKAHHHVKTAILMELNQLDYEQASELLARHLKLSDALKDQ